MTFKEGRLSGHVNTGDSSVLLRVPDSLPPKVAERWNCKLGQMRNNHGAYISGSKENTRNLKNSRTAKHKRHSYRMGAGHGSDWYNDPGKRRRNTASSSLRLALEEEKARSSSQISFLQREIDRLQNVVEVARDANLRQMSALHQEVIRMEDALDTEALDRREAEIAHRAAAAGKGAPKRPEVTPSPEEVAACARALREESEANFAAFRAVLASQFAKVSRSSEYQVREPTHDTFKKGFIPNQSLHRVLLPLRTFKTWCMSALSHHMDAMMDKGHLQFDVEPGDAPLMWRVVQGRPKHPEVIPDLQPDANGNRPYCRITAIELSLDYATRVERFYLRPPEGKGADRFDKSIAFVKGWRDITIAEKGSQFDRLRQASGDAWPELPAKWGRVETFDDMPCVLWIYIPAHQASKRA